MGNARGLEQYGIQLTEASTKTERLAAMQRLAQALQREIAALRAKVDAIDTSSSK